MIFWSHSDDCKLFIQLVVHTLLLDKNNARQPKQGIGTGDQECDQFACHVAPPPPAYNPEHQPVPDEGVQQRAGVSQLIAVTYAMHN